MVATIRSVFLVWGMVFAGLAGFAVAAPETVTREATGFGPTYQAATAAALLEAARQVRGTEVSSRPELVMEFERMVDVGGATSTGVIETRDKVSSTALGWIASYEVLSVREPAKKDDDWKVTVRAAVPVPTSMEPADDRPSLVVAPVRFVRGVVGRDESGRLTLPDEVALRLQDGIQTRLVQSGRFAVLNRDFGGTVLGENALLASGAVPPAEAAKFGQLAGADMVLTGTVFQMGADEPGPYGMAPQVRFEFAWQLIESPTQKILWSERLVREVTAKYDERASEVIDRLSADVVASVLDTRFPVLVLDVAGPEEILLNQGRARLAVGQQLSVFSESRSLKDPQTGKMISVEGRRIATVEVTGTSPEHSTAKLVDGSLAGLRAGQALRRVDTTATNASKSVRPTAGSSEAPVQW